MQIIKKLSVLLTVISICMLQVLQIYALDDGAYLIGCSTSYANPLTGQTEDGGSNIALGESMVASIVERQLLLEQVRGNTYITIGLGLASNVSNVRIQIMNKDGTKYSVTPTLTGSSQANGDTVNHYRIQISSLTQYISPILFVNPMGRDVQFFIQLNTSDIIAGTGVYNALEIPVASKQETTTPPSSTSNPTESNVDDKSIDRVEKETPDLQKATDEQHEDEQEKKMEQKESVTEVDKASLFMGVNGLSLHTLEAESTSYLKQGMYTLGIIIIIIAGGILYVKKVKK